MAASVPQQAALEYARCGWPVLPCNPVDKSPFIYGGFKSASTDLDLISKWWWCWPGAMIGVPTGEPTGFWAIDPDLPEEPGDADGLTAWRQLVEINGAPPTRRHRTPSGAEHWLLRWHPDKPIGCSSGNLPPGVHVRGQGGYIIVPPSRRADGRSYEVIDSSEIAEAPQWTLELIASLREAVGANGHAAPRMGGPPLLGQTEELPKALYFKVLKLVRLSERVTGRHQRRILGILRMLLQKRENRNIALNDAAYLYFRPLVAAGVLSRDAAESLLIDAAMTNGYIAKRGHRKAIATIRSGLGAANGGPPPAFDEQGAEA